LLFAQSLIIQFNGNIDNIVIGAVLGASAVTVYSFAIQIFNMYETCATSVSSVILPTIAEQIYSGATPKQLSDTVKKFGRVQWIFLGGALFAFICFGNEFFHLWLGEEFNDCYKLSLILMIPVTFPLVVNVCLAILKVKNLLTFRTISMAYSVVFNALLTIIGTHFWGYWAAAVGTAVSTIVGSIISMNIYYQKKLDINIFKLYISISGRITPCLLLACLVGFILNRFIYGFWIGFICKAVIFILVYGLLLIIFGLNESEKESLIGKRRIKS
jgi:O-antigen/teichoic acid export membrane protein